jgi:FkbM family methyltransferase
VERAGATVALDQRQDGLLAAEHVHLRAALVGSPQAGRQHRPVAVNMSIVSDGGLVAMGLRRQLADTIGRAFKVHVIRYGKISVYVEQDYLRRFLSDMKIDCVFDVGANDGQYAEMIRSLDYKGPIISFEPIPESAERLRAMAARDSAWFVEEIALDDVERDASFNVMATSQFSSLRAPNHSEVEWLKADNSVSSTVELRTARLDTYFEIYREKLGFRRPFLKMDTQGNDLNVARGGARSLEAFVGLQSELAVMRLYDGQPTYREAIDFYQSRNFQLSAFVPNNAGHFPQLVETDCIMFNPAMVELQPR